MATIMERTLVGNALLLLVWISIAAAYVDLSNLGQQIQQSVQQGVAPLQNLGQQINQGVHEQLERAGIRSHYGSWRNGRNNYNNFGFENNFDAPHIPNPPLPDFGSRIAEDVQDSVRPLENLGPQIEQGVYQALEPVRALELIMKMKDGVGGNTVKTFLPGEKSFIRSGGQTYKCDGKISTENGKCDGNLTPFRVQAKEDQCFTDTRAFITTNNGEFMCLSDGPFGTVSVVNNQIVCKGRNGQTHLVSKKEYTDLCGNVASSVKYRYYADESNPAHVQIPNSNRHLKCSNQEKGICEFTEDLLGASQAFVITAGGNFYSNSN